MPDRQPADTLPDLGEVLILADGISDPHTMRGMALGPVNPHQVNRMGGVDPVSEDEFLVTHLSNLLGKTSGGHQAADHRGTIPN